jgi:hypothetical protein
MSKFQPHINPVYPPNNLLIFEEWFWMQYKGCNTDRELLPVHFTSYWVNHDYGNDKQARKELSDFLGTLDKSKKYFSVIQYDDGSMIDWRLFGLDVLEFNMSKTNGIMIPLICMPHPYQFKGGKKLLASFIGGRTHPVRNELEKLKNREGWHISYDLHNIEDYCKMMHESIFTLCPRGYGINSFRICEAMQYGSIPVYISDDFVKPFDADFNEFGVAILSKYIEFLAEELEKIDVGEIVRKQENIQRYYEEYYSYHGCFNNIIKSLEDEYHSRQQVGKEASPDGADEESGAWRV